jgi:hypothetical protein
MATVAVGEAENLVELGDSRLRRRYATARQRSEQVRLVERAASSGASQMPWQDDGR